MHYPYFVSLYTCNDTPNFSDLFRRVHAECCPTVKKHHAAESWQLTALAACDLHVLLNRRGMTHFASCVYKLHSANDHLAWI